MQRYVKIGDLQVPAFFSGMRKDAAWDDRESKTITCEMPFDQARELFVNDAPWSIIEQADSYTVEDRDEEGNIINTTVVTPDPVELDNSEFCLAGDLTDHRDGTISAKMGKLTDLEEAYDLLYGGEL